MYHWGFLESIVGRTLVSISIVWNCDGIGRQLGLGDWLLSRSDRLLHGLGTFMMKQARKTVVFAAFVGALLQWGLWRLRGELVLQGLHKLRKFVLLHYICFIIHAWTCFPSLQQDSQARMIRKCANDFAASLTTSCCLTSGVLSPSSCGPSTTHSYNR